MRVQLLHVLANISYGQSFQFPAKMSWAPMACCALCKRARDIEELEDKGLYPAEFSVPLGKPVKQLQLSIVVAFSTVADLYLRNMKI